MDQSSKGEAKTFFEYQIENRFTYHKPIGNQAIRYFNIRERAKDLAYLIHNLCPESREKSLAMTRLEEAVMWANASIARNEVEGTATVATEKVGK